MEPSIEQVGLALDQACAEIQHRWFVWTAAGLTVHPVTWADHATPRSLRLQVTRPNARAEIVLSADGRTEAAVCRPDTEVTVREVAQVGSTEAFGLFLDRMIELITWSGEAKDHDHSGIIRPAPSEEAGHWVLGHDGLPLTIEP